MSGRGRQSPSARSRRPFDAAERAYIGHMLLAGLSASEIARRLGRAPSVVAHLIQREADALRREAWRPGPAEPAWDPDALVRSLPDRANECMGWLDHDAWLRAATRIVAWLAGRAADDARDEIIERPTREDALSAAVAWTDTAASLAALARAVAARWPRAKHAEAASAADAAVNLISDVRGALCESPDDDAWRERAEAALDA